MLRKLMIIAMAIALGAWGLAACDNGGDGDGDGDSDSDADADLEAWPCTPGDTNNPQFRLTAMEVTAPVGLRNALLQAIIDGVLDEFGFVWLVDLDLAGNSMDTGSGMPVDPAPDLTDTEFCSMTWNTGDYAPATGVEISVTGDTISTVTPITLLRIPMYTSSGTIELPISQLELIDVQMSSDRVYVGSPSPDPPRSYRMAGTWNHAGQVRGWISVDDAQAVVVTDLEQTLCGLLSGDTGLAGDPSDDCSSPQADWENQPSQIPDSGGTMGYELQANIGAGACSIN